MLVQCRSYMLAMLLYTTEDLAPLASSQVTVKLACTGHLHTSRHAGLLGLQPP